LQRAFDERDGRRGGRGFGTADARHRKDEKGQEQRAPECHLLMLYTVARALVKHYSGLRLSAAARPRHRSVPPAVAGGRIATEPPLPRGVLTCIYTGRVPTPPERGVRPAPLGEVAVVMHD
jgi:hypothetical protein